MSPLNPTSAPLPPENQMPPQLNQPNHVENTQSFWDKYKITILTFPLAVAAFTLFFGFLAALWFTLIMLCHEMGHYIAARRENIPTTVPIFLPFMGAVIALKEMPQNAQSEARFALWGPIGGLLATVLVLPIAIFGGFASLQLAIVISAFIHIFNMVPMLPLDGGRILGAVSRFSWVLGVSAIVAYGIWSFSFILLLIGLFGGLEMYQSFRKRFHEARPGYYDLSWQKRANIGLAWLALTGLAIGLLFLGVAMWPNLF